MRGRSELLAAMVCDIAVSGWGELGASRWRVLSLHTKWPLGSRWCVVTVVCRCPMPAEEYARVQT